MPPRRGTMPSWSWTIRPSRSWRASPGRGSRTGSRMRSRSGGSSSRGGADGQPAGRDRPGDYHHRPPHHFRRGDPVPTRCLHRRTAPFGVITGQESGRLGLLDLRTLQLRQVLPIGSGPDVLAFDPALGQLYVAAESGVVAVFGERAGSIAQLGWYRAPKTHSVAVDPATHRVYLPLADVSGRPLLRILVPSDSH